MELVQDPSRVEALRGELIQNLKDFGFDGQAIVALVLNSEAVVYAPKEPVLRQGKREEFIFFMMEGNIEVALSQGGEERVIGSREPFTLLGEIAFFNKTAASATGVVTDKGPATLFRLSYEHFEKIVSDFTDVKAVLMRIGDLRVINQYNGFAPFANYMELIGWQRDRFALNRAISGDLEFAVETVLFPHLQPGRRVLEVGDGPAIVLEMINGAKPDMLPGLFLQANHLEDAIMQPRVPQASDFSRAKSLKETFDFVVALQVFNLLDPEQVPEQLEVVKSLLVPGGLLLAVKIQLVEVHYEFGSASTSLIFADLENMIREIWPAAGKDLKLVNTTFVDAALTPAMEWNPQICERVRAGEITIPEGIDEEKRHVLEQFLEQARRQIFLPDDLHLEWLAWKASQEGFTLEKSDKNYETGFAYQAFRLAEGA